MYTPCEPQLSLCLAIEFGLIQVGLNSGGLDSTISPFIPLEGNLISSSYPSWQLLIQLFYKICKTDSEIPCPSSIGYSTSHQSVCTSTLKCLHLLIKVPFHHPTGGPYTPYWGRCKVRHFANCYGSIYPFLCAQLERSPSLIKSSAKETCFGMLCSSLYNSFVSFL